MKRYLSIALVCFSIGAIAQERMKHEFYIHGGGGISSLKYKLSMGEDKIGFGGNVGFGYTYFLNNNVGFSSGLEFGRYNAKVEVDEHKDSYITQDFDGEHFEYRTSVKGHTEKQNATFIQIPIMVQYQTSGMNKFYASVGGKIGIPISSKYKIEKAVYDFRGFYNQEEIEYTEEHRFLGFGTFAQSNVKDDLKLKIAFLLSAETGIKWNLGNSFSLYTGIYVDYGLNDINKHKGSKNLIGYNTMSPKGYECNSILNAKYSDEGKESPVADKINLLSTGVKIKFAFGK